MRHIFSNDKDYCLLASAAMVLDVEMQELIDEIGHDGQEILWPQFNMKRGYHIQEILDCFVGRDKFLVLVEMLPVSTPKNSGHFAKEVFNRDDAYDRFQAYLENGYNGILIGETTSGATHAVAWDAISKLYHDPRIMAPTAEANDFYIREFWMVVP